MTKREFAEAIAKAVDGRVRETVKDNGVVKMGVCVPIDPVMQPIFYIDEAYDRAEEVAEVVDYIRETIKDVKVSLDIDWVNDYAKAKAKIKVKLVNKAKNKGVEVQRSAKSYGFPDLVLVPYVDGVEINGQQGRIAVTNTMIESWGVTKRTVIDNAIKNIIPEIMPLQRKLAEMTGLPEFMFESPITIVSIDGGIYGAVGIIKAREELKQMFPNGYDVIPSGVNEVLVVPSGDTESLNGIIGDVNTDVLDATDYLSDHAYTFAVA